MSTTGIVVDGWTVLCAVNVKQLFQRLSRYRRYQEVRQMCMYTFANGYRLNLRFVL